MIEASRPHLPSLSRRTGRLEVVCGSMFSGKSEELIRRLTRADIARQRVLAVKPGIDDRYASDAVASHAGARWPCRLAGDSATLLRIAREEDPDVLGIEEAQFFDEGIIPVVQELVSSGVRVICAGLDLTAEAKPFGPMPQLICDAEEVTKLSAVCMCCGEDAYRSQLLVDGLPAGLSSGDIVVGAAERYEARCRACYQQP